MWKIKLITKNEELGEDREEWKEESDLKMKTYKNDGDIVDLTSAAQKKLKQARLPFQILSPKCSPLVNKDSEKVVKKRKLSDDATVEVSKTKLCKTDVKENVCKPVSGKELIVIEDSVELMDTVEDIKSNIKNDCIIAEEENTISVNENKSSKKRTSSEDDNSENKTNDPKQIKKSKNVISNVAENSAASAKKILVGDNADGLIVFDENSVEIIEKDKDVSCELSKSVDESDVINCNERLFPTQSNVTSDIKPVSDNKPKEIAVTEKLSKTPLKGDGKRKKKLTVSRTGKATTRGVRESNRIKENALTRKLLINKSKEKKNNDSNIAVNHDERASSLHESSKIKDFKPLEEISIKEKPSILEKMPGVVKESPNKAVPHYISSESDSFVKKESANAANTSDLKTPKSATKRQLTPKQLLKKQESEKKRQEKDRLRREKEEKLNHLKEERNKLKIEKEESRKRYKEEKEKKRLMELELKNEEKRAKEEEKKAKEEERKKREEAKEEERRKRDEAKEEERKKKEAVKRKEEKAATAFASFFTPKRLENKSLSSSTEDVTDSVVAPEKFMPFEVKGDMKLATIHRRMLEIEKKTALDNALLSQSCERNDLYIDKLKANLHTPLSDIKTWPLQDDSDDDVIVIESEVVEDNNEEEKKSNCEKKRLHRPRAKLLQFVENRRPPYWGTWRKKSSVIGPRKPFGHDNAMFEYDIDSDDEWEEEEPGESLHGSDDEKESEDEYEVDNKVFVPHGYLSDEEAQDEMEDMSPEAQKAKLQLLEIEFEAEMKEKTEKLKPRLIGCVWFNNNIEDPKSVSSHIAEMLLLRRAVLWDYVKVPIDVEQSNSISSSPAATPAKSDPIKIAKSNIFPETAVPDLIKLVHGNRFKHKFLVEEFYNYMSQSSKSISEVPSKNAISNKKREISEWMVYPQEESSNHPMTGRRCWYVSREVREKFGVLDQTSSDEDVWMYSLEVPRSNVSVNSSNVSDQTPPVTPITKFTKILSQEERQKQLKLQSKSSNTSSNEKQKLGFITPVSSQKSVKSISSKKARRSVMDAFMKGTVKQEKGKTVSVIEMIELSPEKPFNDSVKIPQDLPANSPRDLSSEFSSEKIIANQTNIIKSIEKDDDSGKHELTSVKATKMPAKTIKRITPICLSPMKHKKKL